MIITALYNKKYTVDEHFFDQIDTEAKAYFFGLLFADGTMRKNVNGITLKLKEDDIYIIKEFKLHIGTTAPLIKDSSNKDNIKWSNTYYINIYNSYIASVLNSYGMVPRKSLIKVFPEVILNSNEDIIRHFIRGYFDGNGSIGISYSKVVNNKIVGGYFKITSTYDMCQTIKNLLDNYVFYDVNACRVVFKKGKIYNLYITKRNNMFKVLDWMYNNSSGELMLKRKYEKYVMLKVWYNHVA